MEILSSVYTASNALENPTVNHHHHFHQLLPFICFVKSSLRQSVGLPRKDHVYSTNATDHGISYYITQFVNLMKHTIVLWMQFFAQLYEHLISRDSQVECQHWHFGRTQIFPRLESCFQRSILIRGETSLQHTSLRRGKSLAHLLHPLLTSAPVTFLSEPCAHGVRSLGRNACL